MELFAMQARMVGVILALTALHEVTSKFSPTCEDLQKSLSPVPERYLSVEGQVRNISLYWGSDPARAASALFTVILRHAHGYQNVSMKQGEDHLTNFAKSIFHDTRGAYNDSILALSMAWDPTTEPLKKYKPGYSTGLGAPRLQEIDVSRVPACVRLHVHIPPTFREKEQCKQFAQWHFYTNRTALENCGFIDNRAENTKGVLVYIILDSSNKTFNAKENLKTRVKEDLLQFKDLDRQSHFKILDAANESFLFIDYDMWKYESDESDIRYVNTVQEPPCLSNDTACLPGLDNAIGMRVAEVLYFREHASQLYQLAHKFIPPIQSLRFILNHTTNSTDIEEAACKWVSENIKLVKKKWVKEYKPTLKKYKIATFYSHSPDNIAYESFINYTHYEIFRQFNASFQLILRTYPSNYFDSNYVKSNIANYMTHSIREDLIGAVVGGDDKTTEIVRTLDQMGLPVLSYDVAAEDANSTTSVWLTAGRLAHLALAVKDFIRSYEWRRVAVLSDLTLTAKLFLEDLKNASDAVRDHPVKHNLSNTDAETILEQLKTDYIYIIVVNTHHRETLTILTAAAKLKMNGSEYVWIVREWEQDNVSLNVNFFTFSFWCQSAIDVSNSHNGSQELLAVMDKLWPNKTWPRSAAALLDALWTMAEGFQDVLRKYPEAREDPHNEKAISQFGQSLVDLSPIKGFTQNLVFKGHSLETTVIYLNKWHNGTRQLLSKLYVNATSSCVTLVQKYEDVYPNGTTKPSDGTPVCLLFPDKHDKYLPGCYDTICIAVLVLVLVVPSVITLIYFAVRRHIKELQMKLVTDLLAQRMERAATLSSYLVDRSTLKPREELGAGRFGCVRLADLHVPGCKAQVVAAKELRDHQDESEILREACILASLKHHNIIRLVGVCIDNEPTLVLMEVAFFGDLLQYLKDRRHIAESVAFDAKMEEQVSEEAAHVSAKSLTRLAREAASALAYLALCGVIHRDLRASNCLVDERRSLKLADFGLARETKAKGLDGGGEYACRRRGLFPVLWMAPESLISGVFSAASDVYSLGMLIFELVTLGARPYGKISPLRVMQYVTSGGMPRMPADATPQAAGLAQLCWQRQPEKRPTAADLVAYLAENPKALSPAFDYENNQPTGVESGYGESPSTAMLIPK